MVDNRLYGSSLEAAAKQWDKGKGKEKEETQELVLIHPL